MQIYLQTHVHTHIHVQDGSVYIYVSRSIYLDQSLGFHANSFVSLSLIDKSDFDEKNTNDKRVFHRNLSLFDVCYTHLYTTVTIFKKKQPQFLFFPSSLRFYIYLTVRRSVWYRQAKATSLMPSKIKRSKSA